MRTDLSFTEISTKTNIASDNLVGSNKIYINVSDGSNNDVVFNPLVNSGTSSDFQLSSDTFYGKMLDDENGLQILK